MTHSPECITAADLRRIEAKLDRIEEHVTALEIGLAVHKVKTGWIAALGSAFVSLLIGVGAYLLR